MFLIFKRENPYGPVIFYSLDDIKKSIKSGEIYGEYKWDSENKCHIKNKYKDFEIIENPEFPIILCDKYSVIENIIYDIGDSYNNTYYFMDKHSYAHGVWSWPTEDGTKLIFDNLIDMKYYCKDIVRNGRYLNGSNDMCRINDMKLIVKKMNKLAGDNLELHEKIVDNDKEYNEYHEYYSDRNNNDTEDKIEFKIGNDFHVSFTISKIKE